MKVSLERGSIIKAKRKTASVYSAELKELFFLASVEDRSADKLIFHSHHQEACFAWDNHNFRLLEGLCNAVHKAPTAQKY